VPDIPRLAIGFNHHPGSQPHSEPTAESLRWIKCDHPPESPDGNGQGAVLTSDFFSTGLPESLHEIPR
jgi:hypothetical protein